MNYNLKSICLLFTFLLAAASVQAQGPNNTGTYYKNANGKSGAALKTALSSIIGSPSVVSYSGLIDAYEKTDTRADGTVRDWYSNITKYQHGKDTGGYKKEGDSYNREHSVPQSWFNEASPMKSDIVHVVPTDGYVNNRRSNYVLAEVGTVEWASANSYCKLGSCKTAGYSGKVFEPNDEIKGDMARIYFYMVTCYEDRATGWGHGVFTSSKYPGLEQWYIDMLMRWSKQDPVDEVERARNNAVYTVQKNRNPFVDYPGLEDYVWGTKKTEAFSYDNYQGGGGTEVTTVAQPVFTPEEGSYTDQVVVSMSTTTEDATIYYTTNNANATVNSNLYTGPITLTETTTLKAIAVKEGAVSYQTTATYTVTAGSGEEKPVDGLISLNSTFFNVSYTGSISSSNTEDLVGTKDGVTVVYALGDGGANRYCNSSQIRLYQKNKLTISVSQGNLTELEFQLAKETSKKLSASTGRVADLTWTGSAQSVTFNVDDGSGNMQLSGVKVKTSGTSGIESVTTGKQDDRSFRTLSGTRVRSGSLRPGIYIHQGKKVIIK
ncbi:MAG: endonuclease [Prevotella sp.]|nr:endonuclease [Prevotella sp.]